MASDHYITVAELRAVLHYDPHTGVFTWRERADQRPQWNARHAGEEAGTVWGRTPDAPRYRQICINRTIYRAHRLAWLYMTGRWPQSGMVIDHCDGDGLNNRWTNLRLATQAQNIANSRAKKTEKTGLKGICFYPPTGKYRAEIRRSNQPRHIGYFDTPEEAHSAYAAAHLAYHGQFSKT